MGLGAEGPENSGDFSGGDIGLQNNVAAVRRYVVFVNFITCHEWKRQIQMLKNTEKEMQKRKKKKTRENQRNNIKKIIMSKKST